MNNISTIDGMHQFLQQEVSVEFSCRGRKFIINGEELTLNAIVKKVQAIACTELPADETANEQLCDISHRIKQMDREGNIELAKQNFFLKIATFFRRLFGNFGFDRKAIMAEMLQTRLSEKLYEDLLKLYKKLEHDPDDKKFFSLTEDEPLHVLFMLSHHKAKSFFKNYQKPDFKWKTDKEKKLFLAISEMRLLELNELNKAVNNVHKGSINCK
jgi:hypothetical protein